MIRNLFDMDRPFWRWVGKIPELTALSLFWYICSIPVITILPASCALFDAVSRCTLPDDKGSFRRFFRTFWQELKQGIPLTLFWLVLAFIAHFGSSIIALGAKEDPVMQFMYIAYLGLILLTAACLCWLVPLQSRYHSKFLNLHINSVRFLLGRLPGTGLMLLTTALIVIVCTAHPTTNCLLLVAPAVNAVFHALVVEKAFQAVFPDDYVDGVLVTSEEDRAAAQEIAKAKQAEKDAAEEY